MYSKKFGHNIWKLYINISLQFTEYIGVFWLSFYKTKVYSDLCCAIQNVNDAVCRFRLSFSQLFSILSKRIVMLYLLTFTEVMKNDKSCVVFPPGIHITLRRIEITNALKTTGSFIIIFTNVFDRGTCRKHSELACTAFLLHLHYLPGPNFLQTKLHRSIISFFHPIDDIL